ncbi:NAD(P)-binding protein [Lentinula aciculospora]|uniref:NAD(P)-binding protein n=1 Tax=Lentinula aciculospora TaxID=153920 RepID=A0A9W9DM47_9AGAR|nr:NAD(P)-binding protein [Lentinula aciculospora]
MITAVFVGGTSGIGRAMAEAFARKTNGDAHIVIVGRNKSAADELISSFPKPDTNPVHEFISSDVSLISNVHKTTADLVQRLHQIDYLVLSCGVLILAGRNETSEGLDDKMALSYYSRWTFIHDLMPLLQKSEQGAKVYSILASGANAPIDKDNLDLKKNHTLGKMTAALTTYTNVAFQKFARDEPSMSFNHAYPGLVRSPMLTPSTWYWKIPYYLVYPVFLFMSVTPEVSGNIHLNALSESPAGFNSYDPKGHIINYSPADEETVELVWKHTLELTERLREL